MAETYGFFDSENHDRPYTSTQMSQYFQGIVTNGVFDGIGKNLVPYINGPYVKIPPGRAVVDCHWYNNDDTVALNFPITSASVRCILVLACDYIQRRIYPEIKQGTSVNLPDITDTENIKYLKLANLQISSSTATVTKVCIGDDTPLLKNLTEYVVKEEGKSLSTNDFTDAYKSQVDANKSDISELKSKTDATNTEVGKKANSSDVYTKSETDSRITSKVSEIVAGAPEDFDTLKEMSDWLLNHEDNAAAMNTAIGQNTNDISTLKDDVLLQKAVISEHSSAIQENESQITGLDVRLTQAEEKVTKNILKIDENAAEIEALKSEDSRLLNNIQAAYEDIDANTESISALDERVTANENAISGNISNINAVDARVDSLFDADTQFSKDIASVNATANIANGKADNLATRVSQLEDDITTQSAVNSDHIQRIKDNASGVLINKSTLGYQRKNLFDWNVADRAQNFYTTVTNETSNAISISSKTKWSRIVYKLPTIEIGKSYILSVRISELNESGGDSAKILLAFDTSGNNIINASNLEKDGVYEFEFNVQENANSLYLLLSPNWSGTTYTDLSNSFTVSEVMLRYADVTDDTYEPYVDDVDTRLNAVETTVGEINGELGVMSRNIGAAFDELDAFEIQSQLYSNTSVSASVLTVNIQNLFADYSAVICNIVTSNGRYTQVLPLKYIESLGTDTYYQAGEMIYYYVDDSNLKIYTGLGQSNPTMTQVQIIGIY